MAANERKITIIVSQKSEGFIIEKKKIRLMYRPQIFLFGHSKASLQPADINTPHIKANIHPS